MSCWGLFFAIIIDRNQLMKFLEYINKSILVLIIFFFSIISFVKAEETKL